MIKVKRLYDPAVPTDGYRVLLDRVWPRGLSKGKLRIDDWLKEVAPSAELRKWFDHDPAKWIAFKDRYFRELDEQSQSIECLLAKCRKGTVMLVFGAKDPRFNNAVALKEHLGKRSRKYGPWGSPENPGPLPRKTYPSKSCSSPWVRPPRATLSSLSVNRRRRATPSVGFEC